MVTRWCTRVSEVVLDICNALCHVFEDYFSRWLTGVLLYTICMREPLREWIVIIPGNSTVSPVSAISQTSTVTQSGVCYRVPQRLRLPPMGPPPRHGNRERCA